MPCHKYHNSKIEAWLKKNKMSTNELVEKIGCSRPTLWKAKRGIPICPATAKKIEEVTNGEVIVEIKRAGKPSYKNNL